jgi:signal transduction histidine kinase
MQMAMNVLEDPDVASRRARRVDAAAAFGLAVFLVVGTYFASQGQPARRPFDAGTVVLLVAAAGAIAFRRRWPVGVLWFVFAVDLTYFVLNYAAGPIWLTLVISSVTAVVEGHLRAAVIATAVGFVSFPWLDYVLRDRPAPPIANLVGLAAWLLVVLGAGLILHTRRERVAEAARMREEERLRRTSEERLRIARELHDALGHHLSLINVQSGVALHLNEELPEQTRASLTAIKEASKEALDELRSVLEILREGGESAPRTPALTLDRLDALAAQAATAGLEVRTETEGEARPLPFGVEAAAFRIIQEALTNVTRHAGHATATVRVAYGPRDLTVEIDDDGRGPTTTSAAPGGKGILGMRERASALGGSLDAGPRPGGGFRVKATLPLDGAA